MAPERFLSTWIECEPTTGEKLGDTVSMDALRRSEQAPFARERPGISHIRDSQMRFVYVSCRFEDARGFCRNGVSLVRPVPATRNSL